MKWWIGSLLLLLAGVVLKLGLLVYAMYILVGMLLISRYLSRTWVNSIVSSRRCSADVVEIGETVNIEVKIANRGLLSIAWIFCEDFLAREALVRNPPSLEVKGARLTLVSLPRNEEKQLSYTLKCHRRGYFKLAHSCLKLEICSACTGVTALRPNLPTCWYYLESYRCRTMIWLHQGHLGKFAFRIVYSKTRP